MGTPANLSALAALGASADARPGDVVIAVDGEDGAGRHGRWPRSSACWPAAVRNGTAVASPRARAPWPARIVRRQRRAHLGPRRVRRARGPPGAHARACTSSCSPTTSPLDDEVELKRRGATRGLLVMGPECGTAMLGGVGLGFANVVRSGPVGIVAAAGTGAQEAACLLDARGRGVSHIIGVGGRDLSAAVGGIDVAPGRCGCSRATSRRETLLLVAKEPPALDAAALGGSVPAACGRSAAFVGWDGASCAARGAPDARGGGARGGAGATAPDGRRSSVERASRARRSACSPAGRSRTRRASCSSRCSGAVATEPEAVDGDGHVVLDLGDAAYTQGRPHPMVDLERPAAACSKRRSPTTHGLRPARRRLRPRRPPRPRRPSSPAPSRVRPPARTGHGPRVRHGRRPAGRGAPGSDAARGGRDRCAVQRGRRAARARGRTRREDRDAHLLRAPARRGRARAVVAGRPGRARPRSRAVRARTAGQSASSARRRCRRTCPPRAARRARSTSASARCIDAYTEGLRAPLHDGRFDVVHSQDCLSANAALDAARRRRRSAPWSAPSTTSTTSRRRP